MTSPAPAGRAEPPPRLHLKHVEGLRAVAALIVFVNHAYAQVWGETRSPEGPLAAFSYSLIAGHLSVAVFIVVSGFCLALPVVANADQIRGGALTFFKRRARRILPPYYAALALSLLLIWTVIGEPTGTLWDVPIQVTTSSIVAHLLLLQDFFGTGSINYVFWSIAVEWQIYFLFPILVYGWRRFGPLPTIATALLAGYALRLGFDGTRIARANGHFIGLFALGMLAAYVSTSTSATYVRLRQARFWPWLAAAAFGVVCWLTARRDVEFPTLDGVVGVFATAALVVSSRDSGNLLARFFSLRPLVAIGTFSYSLYLIHAPLLQLIWQYALAPLGLGAPAMFGVLMSVGLAAVLAASYAFFRAFELPFMQNARGAERVQRAAAPAPG